MTRERPPQASPARASLRLQLLALLHAGDLDAALQAGLLDYPAVPGDPGDAPLLAAQAQLQAAWAARERHRARDQRLARLADERQARRTRPTPTRAACETPTLASPVASNPATSSPVASGARPPTAAAPDSPDSPDSPGATLRTATLPAAAAAALARARARVAGQRPG